MSSEASPRRVGRYVIHEEFAAGGMASVHLGRLVAEGGFTRTIAIKRLFPQHAKDPMFVAMLFDEARLAARIRHPNVVPILDVVSMDGEVFLVMEYVHGESLSGLMRAAHRAGTTIPARIASSVVCGALHGLSAAHAATSETGDPLGIVHRDVSPENVLVGADGTARVLDFGVALAQGRSQVTREGGLKGKLGYMAPELLEGHKATPLSDVYSTGVVLWEALVGNRLFTGENEGIILGKVLRGNPPRPSEVAPVPRRVDDIVMCAMARSPVDRFASAHDFAQALEACLLPATSREVGVWVTETAKANLGKRADLLARVERSGAVPEIDAEPRPITRTDLYANQTPTAVDAGPPGFAARSASATDGALPTDPTGRAVTTLPAGAPAASPPLNRTALLALGGVTIATFLGAIVIGARALSSGEHAGAAATVAAGAPSTPAPAPAPTAEAPPSEPAPVVPATATATAAPTAPNAEPSASARRKSASPSARPRGPAGGCNPPFTVDARGLHHYKPGCM